MNGRGGEVIPPLVESRVEGPFRGLFWRGGVGIGTGYGGPVRVRCSELYHSPSYLGFLRALRGRGAPAGVSQRAAGREWQVGGHR